MKVIIAGSREITDYSVVKKATESSGFEITEVVSGGARGVDRLGERWARENNIPIKQFIPDWDSLGKSAGYARNKDMAKYAEAAIIIWDGASRGTRHMIDLAEKYGLCLYIFDKNGEKFQWEILF